MEIKRRKAQPFTVDEDHEVMELREALAASQREREQLRADKEFSSHVVNEQAMMIKTLQARVEAAQKLIAICAKREEGSEDFFDAELNAFLASAAAPNSAPVTSGDLPKEAG